MLVLHPQIVVLACRITVQIVPCATETEPSDNGQVKVLVKSVEETREQAPELHE